MEYFIKHYFGKIIKQSAKTRYFTMKLFYKFLDTQYIIYIYIK